MERLVINIPDKKSTLVKQVLHGLGVSVDGYTATNNADYKQKLEQVSVWSEEDIKYIEEAKQAFANWNIEEW